MKKIKYLIPLVLLFLWCSVASAQNTQRHFRLGLNADNWSGQVHNANFKASVKAMGIEFIVWHVAPEEFATQKIKEVINYCRENNIGYLFNTELVNYAPNVPAFKADGGASYRWDIPLTDELKNDPLFLGVVHDESLLMQALLGVTTKGEPVRPYYGDTKDLTPEQAYEAVSQKIKSLSDTYKQHGKRLVLETLFPDEAFVGARGGATLAPKLLKENYLDLMSYMASSAARQYMNQNTNGAVPQELWACIDLWYLDTFPNAKIHKLGNEGGHTAENLLLALQYAYKFGYDAAYIEQAKGLMDASWNLTTLGKVVQEFNQFRKQHAQDSDWRTQPTAATLRRFPSGNPGGVLAPFLDMRSYGSRKYIFKECTPESPNKPPFCEQDLSWFYWLAHHTQDKELTKVAEEKKIAFFPGITFNTHPYSVGVAGFAKPRKYSPLAHLTPFLMVDHLAAPPASTPEKPVIDFVTGAPAVGY